ncbi:MAG TPA: 50S ribosomal protein L17 [Verrucomicrobiae bacterium]
MRHRKRTAKLGRTGEHRNAMLTNMVCSLIIHKRITTTLAKARAAKSVAEKMVTLGKKGTLHSRRLASSRLHQEDAVKILFTEIAPAQKDRAGGYTRIIKMGQRQGDATQMVILEFVEGVNTAPAPTEAKTEAAPATPEAPAAEAKPKKKATKKKTEAAA